MSVEFIESESFYLYRDTLKHSFIETNECGSLEHFAEASIKLRDAYWYEIEEIEWIINRLINDTKLNYDLVKDYLSILYANVYRHRPISNFPTESKILEAFRRNDFYCDIIYGPQGVGKSSYALRLAFYVYRDWRAVFLHLFYDPLQLVEFMQFLRKNNLRAPLIIVDDAGILFGRQIYQLDRKRYFAMRLAFDLARAHVSAMIFTVPSHTELAHIFRIANVIVTKIYKQSDSHRLAVKYKRDVLPSGIINVRKLFAERFYVYLPDNVYRLYTKLRNNYIDIMMKLLEHSNEQKQSNTHTSFNP